MRLEGWEARLNAVIERARVKPYRLGEHDCFRVACAAVEALTGSDRWPEWAGRYHSHAQAAQLLADYGGDFDGAFARFFGGALEPVARARRGDIVKFVEREPHLGVCTGERAAVLGAGGLVFVPLAACAGCWRIG